MMRRAERPLFKAERAVFNELKKKIESARYECFKEIEHRGGIFENLGAQQERDLMDFVGKLEMAHKLDYLQVRDLERKVRAFGDEMAELSDNDLKAVTRFVTNYERKNALKVA